MSPFVSEAQRRKLWMKNPKVAAEFERATPKGKKLPEHVKKPKRNEPSSQKTSRSHEPNKQTVPQGESESRRGPRKPGGNALSRDPNHQPKAEVV
jgi:hypothetical protein